MLAALKVCRALLFSRYYHCINTKISKRTCIASAIHNVTLYIIGPFAHIYENRESQRNERLFAKKKVRDQKNDIKYSKTQLPDKSNSSWFYHHTHYRLKIVPSYARGGSRGCSGTSATVACESRGIRIAENVFGQNLPLRTTTKGFTWTQPVTTKTNSLFKSKDEKLKMCGKRRKSLTPICFLAQTRTRIVYSSNPRKKS